MQKTAEDNDWQVLTDTGWSDFDGVKIQKQDEFIELKLSSSKLVCSIGHKLYTKKGWSAIESIKPSNCVMTSTGFDRVVSVSLVSGGLAYDLVGVANNSRYYTNDILSHNCDEFAHLAPNLASEFIASVFPTISSSQESKLVLVSTPNGHNEFRKLWVEAEQGKNGFVTCTGHWSENPTRTQQWADEQRAILGDVMYNQEILVQFNGSQFTLVQGEKLGQLVYLPPEYTKDKLSIFKQPEKGHSYVMTVDTSRGQHLDFSAFVVFDITTLPYRVVATFKDNKISTMAYPFMIWQVAQQYNDAYCLIEINDAGQEIANTLFYEYEYENVYFTHKDELSEGGGYPGVRTTKRVKQVGCAVMKDLIEKDQLAVNSYDIIQELSRYVQKGASYAAEDTAINDDLCTCLFLFGYLTKQELFMDLTDTNIRKILAQKTEEYISEQIMPFGFHSDGFEDMESHSINLDIERYGGTGIDPLEKWMIS